MKKFAAIILLLLYSSANFGLALRLDYCGDSLSDIGFYAGEKEIAECCKVLEMPQDCCNSEQVFLQDQSDKSISSTTLHISDLGMMETVTDFPVLILYPSVKLHALAASPKAPPTSSGQQSLLCVFRI